jgi:methionyl-tRNA formyltransferase
VKILEDLDFWVSNAKEQDQSQKSLAPKLDLSFAEADWEQMSALEIFRRYCAIYGSGLKTLRTFFPSHSQHPFFIESLSLVPSDSLEATLLNSEFSKRPSGPGGIYSLKQKPYSKNIYVRCGDEQWVSIQSGYFATQSRQTAKHFYNNFLSDGQQHFFRNKL